VIAMETFTLFLTCFGPDLGIPSICIFGNLFEFSRHFSTPLSATCQGGGAWQKQNFLFAGERAGRLLAPSTSKNIATTTY